MDRKLFGVQCCASPRAYGKECMSPFLAGAIVLALFTGYALQSPEERALQHAASLQEQEQREAQQEEQRQQDEIARRAQFRQEMADRGLADAHDILSGRGNMRAWHEADQANKTEVAYQLTETMIMRGNVPRNRASFVELYRCLEAAYRVELDTTPVEDVASVCAVSMGWPARLRRRRKRCEFLRRDWRPASHYRARHRASLRQRLSRPQIGRLLRR